MAIFYGKKREISYQNTENRVHALLDKSQSPWPASVEGACLTVPVKEATKVKESKSAFIFPV